MKKRANAAGSDLLDEGVEIFIRTFRKAIQDAGFMNINASKVKAAVRAHPKDINLLAHMRAPVGNDPNQFILGWLILAAGFSCLLVLITFIVYNWRHWEKTVGKLSRLNGMSSDCRTKLWLTNRYPYNKRPSCAYFVSSEMASSSSKLKETKSCFASITEKVVRPARLAFSEPTVKPREKSPVESAASLRVGSSAASLGPSASYLLET